MPALVCRETGRRVALGPRCIVGRGPWVQLQLNETTVSAEHATVYFDGGAWKVRDLGSRNGTYLNDNRIDVQTARVLAPGDELSFGAARQAAWVLESVGPPGPAALASYGAVVASEAGTLWLPRASEPEACVRFQSGRWTVESEEESRAVENGDTLILAGHTYILELPPWSGENYQSAESTIDAAGTRDLGLRFVTSRDQEHVAIEAWVQGQCIPLGARAHNFPLLCLARRRLDERHEGVTESECGWFYAQEFREALQLDRVALNLQLWRATQAMSKVGLPAERLIERRLDAQQLRIGVADLVVAEASS